MLDVTHTTASIQEKHADHALGFWGLYQVSLCFPGAVAPVSLQLLGNVRPVKPYLNPLTLATVHGGLILPNMQPNPEGSAAVQRLSSISNLTQAPAGTQ